MPRVSNTPAPASASGLPQEFEGARERFRQLLEKPKAFLLGAGCSKSAGLPLTGALAEYILNDEKVCTQTKSLLLDIQGKYKASDASNIEDHLGEVTDHLAIAERKDGRQAANGGTNAIYGKEYSTDDLREAAKEVKESIARIIESRMLRADMGDYRRFVVSVHGHLVAGKIGNNCTDYLCLNYDTLLERALALEKIPFADGMEGGEIGWWNPDTYDDRKGLSARVFKLHGSIDWRALDGEPLPRRIGAGVNLPNSKEFMIWPASTKYRETQRDPYAQVAKQGWDAVVGGKRPDTDKVLIIYGYRFADGHINNEIERCICESKGHLTVVAFLGCDKPEGKIKDWLSDERISSQILAYAKKGFFHGAHAQTSTDELPWWKFEWFPFMV